VSPHAGGRDERERCTRSIDIGTNEKILCRGLPSGGAVATRPRQTKKQVAGRANGLKARGKPEEYERRQVELAAKALTKAMAPKRTIEKKEKKVDGPKPGFWLYLQGSDGSELTSTHAFTSDVVQRVWSWAKKHDLCLVSSDWDVQHRTGTRYGWQNAYNVMITNEDFVGDDEELRGFFSTYFDDSIASGKFEAEGEGAQICCYRNAKRKPFWRKPEARGAAR
jgi:hypothetical protein